MRKLCAMLLLLALLPAAALSEVKKDEVVYAKLSASGELQSLYVVNCFEADGAEETVDYGAYAARVNLTDETPLAQSGDETALSLQKGRFSYQGNGLEKTLPWDISIKYSLDGADMSASDIAGKSGKIALALSVSPAESAPEYGVTLQITVTLPGDNCLNIQAENGIVAVAGGNRAVTYALLPGMAAKYTITFDAEHFTMPGIQIAGARMAMDADMYAEAFTKNMAENLQAVAQNMARSMIAGMAAGGSVSFADARNTVQNVQFVMMTEGVLLPTEASAAPTEEKEAGFFDRLLGLFGL